MPDPDASHSTSKVIEKSGSASAGACIIAAFRAANTVLASVFHVKVFFRSKLVRVLAMRPYPAINFL